MAKKKIQIDYGKLFPRITAKPKDVIIDRSMAEAYVHCPFMAHAIRKGEVTNKNKIMEIGSECHRIIAEAFELARENWQEYDVALKYLQEEMTKARPDIQPQVIRAFQGIISELRRIQPGRTIGVESQYSTEFLAATPRRGKVLLSCCLDLVQAAKSEKEVIIIDWKTGFKKRDNAEAFDAFQTQFDSYIIFREMKNIEIIHWFYAMTFYGSRAYACLERERDYFNFEGRTQSAVKLFLDNSQEAWPYYENCLYCEAIFICPWAHKNCKAIGNGKVENLLKQHFITLAKCQKEEEMLKEYCKINGEIQVGKTVFGAKPTKPRINYGIYEIENGKEVTE